MKKLKVLLVNPICMPSVVSFINQVRCRKINADEPLGLAYISAWIRKKMPEVAIALYDHHIDSLGYAYHHKRITEKIVLDLLIKKIKEFKPNIVGVSAPYYMNADVAHETAAVTKDVNKNIVVVMGGIYPTASPEEVLKDTNIDFIIPGEAELAFQDFLEFQLGKKHLNKLQSIAYRLPESNKIKFRKESSAVKDIDELGFPDRTTLPIGKYSIWGRTFVDRYHHKDAVVAAIQPSRGCPFRCTFCCGHIITLRNFRTCKVENVIKEMRYLKNKYGVEVFTFNDENATVNVNWNITLYEAIIRAKLGVRWIHSGGFYVDLMSDELIEKAIESGLIMFNLAIESGSEKILRRVKKTAKIIEKTPMVVKKIRECDPKMCIVGFFICGFPFETDEDVKKTINFARTLDLDWSRFNIFQPFPGCELYNYCIKNGYLSPKAFSRKNLLFYFSAQLKNTLIPPKELEKRMYLANLELNFVNSRALRISNFEQARRDYEHVVAIAPDHALAHWCLARAYEGLGRLKEAQQMKKKTAAIVKKNKTQANYLKHFHIKLE